MSDFLKHDPETGKPCIGSSRPQYGPVDRDPAPQVEKMVVPSDDLEKHGYKPQVGPVDKNPTPKQS